MSLRIGWMLQYRVHGLKMDKPRLMLEGKVGASGSNVRLEFETTPSLRAKVLAPVRVLEVGKTHQLKLIHKPVPRPDQDGYLAPYVWTTATATREVEFPQDLERRHRRGDDVATAEIASLASAELDELHLQAKIAASAFAAHYGKLVVELWAEQPVFFSSETNYRFHVSTTVTSVTTTEIETASLNALVQRVQSALQGGARLTKPLLNAGHWLLSAREAPANTYERFTGFYRVVEILSFFGTKPDAVGDEAKFEKLMQLVAKDDAEMRAFVLRLKESTGKVGVVSRFEGLAARLAIPSALSDTKTFRELNQIRSQLIHGRITRIPDNVSSGRAMEEMQRLAQSYFSAVLAAAAEGKVKA